LEMPPKPKESTEGILRGLYRIEAQDDAQVRLLGSGPILRQVEIAAIKLRDLGIATEVFSATSYGELRREAMESEDWNRRNPSQKEKSSWVQQQLDDSVPVTVAVSDNITAVPDMIRPWVSGTFHVLGTDGFGRSDTREALRRFYGIDSDCIVLDTLSALVRSGSIESSLYSDFRASIDIKEPDDITRI